MFSFKLKKDHSYGEFNNIENRIISIYWKTRKVGEAEVHFLMPPIGWDWVNQLTQEMMDHSTHLTQLGEKFIIDYEYSEEEIVDFNELVSNLVFFNEAIGINDGGFHSIAYINIVELKTNYRGKGVTEPLLEFITNKCGFNLSSFILHPHPINCSGLPHSEIKRQENKLIEHWSSFGFEPMQQFESKFYIKYL